MTDVYQTGWRPAARITATLVFIAIVTFDVGMRADETTVDVTPGPQDGIAYRQGKRSLFRITAVNVGDEPLRVLASTRVRRPSQIAHAREFALPPHSRRVTWHPIYLPNDLPAGDRALEVETVHAARGLGDPESDQSSEHSAARTSSIPLEPDRVVTGLLADSENNSVRQFVVEARRTQNLSDRVTLLRTDALPHMAEWLECFDQLVLASDALVDDPGGLIAVRHWLASGGRLWIMLDRVQPERLGPLLGDDFGLTAVDRVRLAEGAIKDVRDVPRPAHGPSRQFAEPIELVRMIADESAADFEINGWPAAWRQTVGRGSILFTTLEAQAWTDVAMSAEGKASNAKGPLHALASEFFQPRVEPPSLPATAEQLAAGMVGYEVVGRSTVAALLGGSGALTMALVFTPFGRRHRLGAAGIAVVLAIACSSVILALGTAAQRTVPPTLVSMQLIEAAPERSERRVTSIVGAYLPAPVEPHMSGVNSALALNTPLLSGGHRGLLWTDEHRWRLDSQIPAGLSMLRTSWHEPLGESPVVSVSLTNQGITGRLNTHLFDNAEAAVLAAPKALPLAVKIDADGAFHAGSNDRLEAGQFDSDRILDQTAARRQEIYRALFSPSATVAPLEMKGPTLLFWAPPVNPHVSLGDTQRLVGDALTTVPIVVTPPAGGATFAIPSVLLPFEAVDGPDGTPVSSAYSNAQRSWVDGMVAASQITLRFQTPRVLSSLAIKGSTLYLEIKAPSRTVAISGWDGQRPVLLEQVNSPVGRLQTPIRDGKALRLDAEGGLLLTINVGPHPREHEADIAKVGWSITRVWLDVDAAMIERR